MTIVGRRPATELGLRPASRASSSDRAPSGRIVPIILFLIALTIGLIRIAGPASDLYPVEGDSAKYNEIGQGFASLYSHPLDAIGLWLSHRATPQDLKAYHFDSWVLQHAPAYTSFLGIGYLLTGNDVVSGRILTVILFAAAAVLLYLIAREFFGKWPALLSGILFVLWPANWEYAPAILTEIPVTTAALLASYLLMRTARSRRRRAWLAGGIAIGVLILTKTTIRYIAIPWIVIEALVDGTPGRRTVWMRAAYRTVGVAGIWVLWVIFLWGFNLSPNPLAQSGDDWLWIYRGDYVPDRGWETVGVGDAYTPELLTAMRQAEGSPPDRQKREIYKGAFLQTLHRYPGGMAALMLAKAGIFWRYPAVKTFKAAGPISLPPPSRLQPALAVAALLCLALAVGGNGRRWVPAIFPIYLTLIHSATHLVSRYNAPAVPFAMIYAPGALAVVVVSARNGLRSVRAHGLGIVPRYRSLLRPVAISIGAIVFSAILLRHGGPSAILAPWLAAGGLIPIASKAMGMGRIGVVRALVFLLPLATLACGTRADDSLPGQKRIRLSRPGDGVRTRLRLPSNIGPSAFTGAEILLDLLPSERGSMTLSIRLDGKEVGRFDGRPRSDADAFLVDPKVHGADGRYRRILRSVDRHLDGFVRRHHGMENAGYDYYRQWYRIPCDPAVAFAHRDVTIEIVLVKASGGSCDVFADRDAPADIDSRGVRTLMLPAFFENAYELSSYRFDALASDRLLADSRLTRPIRLASERIASEQIGTEGGPRAIRGEARIRLRGRIPGGYGLVRMEGGETAPAWVTDPSKALRMLEPGEIRSIQADRDRYFDGYMIF